MTLRLARAPSLDAAKRGSVLLMLPGGPGVGIKEIMGGEMRAAQHVAEFQRQYDVVTFDPRGIGNSSPIRCDPATAPTAETPMDRAPTQAEFEAVARANAAFIEGCAKASGALLWHLSATDTAQDIERIRQALSPNDGIVLRRRRDLCGGPRKFDRAESDVTFALPSCEATYINNGGSTAISVLTKLPRRARLDARNRLDSIRHR